MQQTEQFDQWALLELMGHQRIAGRVTERVIAGHGFLEISVPETKKNPAFTRFVSPSSIYAVNPLDETTARWYAEQINSQPIQAWDIKEVMEKFKGNGQLALSQTPVPEEEEEEEEHELDPGD